LDLLVAIPMNDRKPEKYLIQRRKKVRTDGRGRSVWADPVESAELELVSTLALKKILKTDDEKSRKAIETIAKKGDDGVLARDPASGEFEIVSDEELRSIIADNEGLSPVARPSEVTLETLNEHDDREGDELSLVSTQALRRILRPGTEETDDSGESATDKDESGGVDPYNTG
jgi:hypothetical protein